MSDLIVKAMLTMDGTGFKGAAKEATGDLNQIKTAADGVTDAGKRMAAQFVSVGDKALAGFDVGALKSANAQLVNVTDTYQKSLGGIDRAALGAAASYKVFTEAQGKSTSSFKLNAFQVQELSYGVRHLGEEIAAGIDPMQIAATQALHLSAAFGSIDEAGALVGTILGSVWTYAGLAAVAVAGLTVAAYEEGKSIDAVTTAINAHLPALSLSRDEIENYAGAVAKAADTSTNEGRKLIQAMADAGVGSKAWISLASAAKQYADVTRTDVDKALDTLLDKLKNPAAALRDLGTTFGVANKSQAEYVQRLQDGNRAQDAFAVSAKVLDEGFRRVNTNTDSLKIGLHALGEAWSATWNAIGAAISSLDQADPDFNSAVLDDIAGAERRTGDAVRAANQHTFEQAQLFQKILPLQANITALLKAETQVQDLVARGDLTNQQGKLALAAIIQQLLPLQKQLNDLQDLGATADVGAALKIKLYYDQFGGFAKQTNDLGAAHYFLRTQLDAGNLTTKQRQQVQASLNGVELQAALAAKQHHDQLLSLDTAGKAWAERIKSLVQGSAEAIAQQKLQADSARDLADAILVSSLAYQQVLDKQAQERAALPYVTAALHAQGAERQRLLDLAQQMRDDTADAQAGQHFVETINDIRSAMASLSDNAGAHALQDALQLQIKDLDDWRDKSLAGLDKTKAGYDDFVQYVGEVYDDKLAQIYERDLARRKDWASGIERAQVDLARSLDDWGKKSQQATEDFAQGFEGAITSAVTDSKHALDDFWQYFLQLLVKMAYEKYLAGTVNSVAGAIVGGIGDVLGLPGGGDSDQTQAPKSINAGVHHSGGIAGVVTPATRQVPASLFYGARRYHEGGIVGDEVPVIAKRGEPILTTVQARGINADIAKPIVINVPAAAAMASNAPLDVKVTVRNLQGQTSQVSSKPDGNGGINIDVLVMHLSSKMAENSQNGRDPLTKSLEETHKIARGI